MGGRVLLQQAAMEEVHVLALLGPLLAAVPIQEAKHQQGPLVRPGLAGIRGIQEGEGRGGKAEKVLNCYSVRLQSYKSKEVKEEITRHKQKEMISTV